MQSLAQNSALRRKVALREGKSQAFSNDPNPVADSLQLKILRYCRCDIQPTEKPLSITCADC